MKYVCTVCAYVYDPEVGDPDNGVEPGTAFDDLPDDWVCPECGVQGLGDGDAETSEPRGLSPSANAISSWRVSAPVMYTMCRGSLTKSVGPVVSYQVQAVAPVNSPYCSVVVSNDSLSAAIDRSVSRRYATDLPAALGPSCCTENQLSPRV